MSQDNSSEWAFYLDMTATPPKLLMRRYRGSESELREPTETEKLEYMDANAW